MNKIGTHLLPINSGATASNIAFILYVHVLDRSILEPSETCMCMGERVFIKRNISSEWRSNGISLVFFFVLLSKEIHIYGVIWEVGRFNKRYFPGAFFLHFIHLCYICKFSFLCVSKLFSHSFTFFFHFVFLFFMFLLLPGEFYCFFDFSIFLQSFLFSLGSFYSGILMQYKYIYHSNWKSKDLSFQVIVNRAARFVPKYALCCIETT